MENLILLLQQCATSETIQHGIIMNANHLSRCHALLYSFHHKSIESAHIRALLQHGASFGYIPCGELFEETFRQYGAGARVDFLLEHGASPRDVPCAVNQLFEDTFH